MPRDRYPSLRGSQEEALLQALTPGKRFTTLCMPTGSGKSLLAVALAQLSGLRTVILVDTKAQQSQYRDQLGVYLYPEMSDLRGKGNYPCRIAPELTFPDAPCHDGYKCVWKDTAGCQWYRAVGEAGNAQIVVMSYAMWLSMPVTLDEEIGSFDLLICDEADTLFDVLESQLAAELGSYEWKALCPTDPFPFADTPLPELQDWAAKHIDSIQIRSRSSRGKMRVRYERLLDALITVRDADENWVMEWHPSGNSFVVTPIWPGDYADRVWKGMDRIVLMSGTITPKTVQMLRLTDEDCDFYSYPSAVEVWRRKVTVIAAGGSMQARRVDDTAWPMVVDQILARRQDRRVIVHTHSYKRRDTFMIRSRFRETLLSHAKSDLELVLAKYRSTPPPVVLVSPSLERGYDFPGDACRTSIVVKVPFPDGRSEVMKARKKRDPEYPDYVTMKTLEQKLGRHIRGVDDWGEGFIADTDFVWFWKRAKKFAGEAFRQSVEWQGGGRPVVVDLIPEPMLG
jgi:Rad3-related DNA helicase